MLNPATIAFGVSIIMMLGRWHFPGVLGTVMNGIGGTTTYLSMLFIGMTLAEVDFRGIFRHGQLFLIVLIKMLLVPVLLVFILPLFGIGDMERTVIILQAAMPAQTILLVLTTEYGGDSLFAAEGVFVTTLASLVTLPLVYGMIAAF